MVSIDYVRTMARYTAWQNESLAGVAEGLSDSERRKERGAFFGSIFATFNHLLWGDGIWLNRFAGTAMPRMTSIADSVGETETWGDYRAARETMDRAITDWASTLDPAWLAGELSWFSGAAQREVTKQNSFLVMHFFNHATHHRGQIHAMLTAAGATPDDTDLFYLP